jgi:hypothetical protein
MEEVVFVNDPDNQNNEINRPDHVAESMLVRVTMKAFGLQSEKTATAILIGISVVFFAASLVLFSFSITPEPGSFIDRTTQQ